MRWRAHEGAQDGAVLCKRGRWGRHQASASTGRLPIMINKSITPSTDFPPPIAQNARLACQASCSGMSLACHGNHCTPRASALLGLVIITSVKNEKEWRRKAVQGSGWDGLGGGSALKAHVAPSAALAPGRGQCGSGLLSPAC